MADGHADDWDPRAAQVLKDQRGSYDGMRERCPVAHSAFMGWSLFRHADIETTLADPEAFSNASRFLAIPNGMDPPVHGKYRSALAGFFDEAQMTKLEPRIRAIAANLLDRLSSSDEIELIGAFGEPFAFGSLCAMLGWPERQWECLTGWVHGNQQAALNKDKAAGKSLAELFSRHVKENLDAHRAAPESAADATDALLTVEVEGERLDDDQIVSVLRNWAAGHGTVVAGLGNLVLHLTEDLALQDQLRDNPAQIPAAIEEILRADGPLVANRRTTTRDVDIQGRRIPKGESLSLMWIAANRDPQAFDAPNEIDPNRDTGASLVWGQGIHLCLGAPLAKLEMRVALEELLSRTTRLELGVERPRRAVYPSNGLEALHLRVSR